MQKFTGKDLKVWLVQNEMTQQQLADRTGKTFKTINTYCNGTPPLILVLALKAIEQEIKQDESI